MNAFLTKYWSLISAIGGTLVTAFTPAVQHWLASHPTVVMVVAGIVTVIAHWLPSPSSNSPSSGGVHGHPVWIVGTIALLLLVGSPHTQAQATTPPTAFNDTTVTFQLSPITLPGLGTSISGAETDASLALTPNNQIGETMLINSAFSFIGGRYTRFLPSLSNALNELSPNLNGMAFQFGLTASEGLVRVNGKSHWGERAGAVLNYEINKTWGLGIDAEYCKLPGYQSNTYSLAFGPNFHF